MQGGERTARSEQAADRKLDATFDKCQRQEQADTRII
jgi:hypothetical protein